MLVTLVCHEVDELKLEHTRIAKELLLKHPPGYCRVRRQEPDHVSRRMSCQPPLK